MFHRTRITLTLWYLLIIMAISIAFSTVIYLGSTREFDRILRIQQYRLQHPEVRIRTFPQGTFQIQPDELRGSSDPQVIAEAKTRLLIELISVNTVILLLAGIAGYFLAGLTLKPIQVMLDEQNRFITDASHELSTPLTSLRTTIEVSLREKQLDKKKAKEILRSNLEEVDSLQALSSKLIELTQYQKTNGNFHTTNISLVHVITQAIRKVSPLANQKHITIATHFINTTVFGEEKSLEELFVILLDNAIKYSPEKKDISIQMEKRNKKIVVSVIDQGIGIAKEDIPRIFDRFYRADKSRTKQEAFGYGLGLSIAKRIIAVHKGTIEVQSKQDVGTTFSVVLPIV